MGSIVSSPVWESASSLATREGRRLEERPVLEQRVVLAVEMRRFKRCERRLPASCRRMFSTNDVLYTECPMGEDLPKTQLTDSLTTPTNDKASKKARAWGPARLDAIAQRN